MPYEVKLEVFEGPIDLLLNLITHQRVDIYDVSISTITEEYLGALQRMKAMDLEVTTGFLVVAATLLELKSARLLPAPPSDDGEAALLEERDMLLARLVECATFREAGSALAAALAAGDRYHARTAGLEERFLNLAPDILAGTTIDQVAAAAARVLYVPPAPELDVSHVRPIRASVREAIAELAGVLRGGRATSFAALCRGVTERIDVVVRFLALLELFKAGAVRISQAERFGDIAAAWTGDVVLAEVIAEAEEYTVSAEEST